MTDETVEFIDPETGASVKVRAVSHAITAAFKVGYIPATHEDAQRCDEIQGLA